MAVVAVSGQLGSRATPIVEAASQALGFDLIDKALITEVARRARADQAAVPEVDEREEVGLLGFLGRWIESESESQPERHTFAWLLAQMPFDASAVDERHHFLDRFEYHRIVEAVIRSVHARGDVIVLGRGGALVLREHTDVLRVRLSASVEYRAEQVAESRKLSYRAALHEVEASDRRRAAFVRRWYHVDWNDPALYHTVINTDETGEHLAAALVVAGARALAERPTAASSPVSGVGAAAG